MDVTNIKPVGFSHFEYNKRACSGYEQALCEKIRFTCNAEECPTYLLEGTISMRLIVKSSAE